MGNIYKRIQQLRNEKRLGREEVAEKLGISYDAYSKQERGNTQLTYDRLERLAEIFDVSLVELIYPKGSPERTQDCLEEINRLKELIKLLKSQLQDKAEIVQLLKAHPMTAETKAITLLDEIFEKREETQEYQFKDIQLKTHIYQNYNYAADKRLSLPEALGVCLQIVLHSYQNSQISLHPNPQLSQYIEQLIKGADTF